MHGELDKPTVQSSPARRAGVFSPDSVDRPVGEAVSVRGFSHHHHLPGVARQFHLCPTNRGWAVDADLHCANARSAPAAGGACEHGGRRSERRDPHPCPLRYGGSGRAMQRGARSDPSLAAGVQRPLRKLTRGRTARASAFVASNEAKPRRSRRCRSGSEEPCSDASAKRIARGSESAEAALSARNRSTKARLAPPPGSEACAAEGRLRFCQIRASWDWTFRQRRIPLAAVRGPV